jgi:hypothetical protein
MIYVILGMHKSGTTLVSEILHKSGISMIAEEDGNPDYETGTKYERVSTAQLNKDILGWQGAHSLDMRKSKRLELSNEQIDRMLAIISQCGAMNADWGFKDPRTCFTYDLWDTHLPQHKLVAVYRSANQVWQHYRSWRHPFRIRKVVQAWITYNAKILDILKNAYREYILLSYETLMSEQQELERLGHFVGRRVWDARRESAFRERSTTSSLLAIADMWGSLVGLPRWTPILRELESLRTKQSSALD